MQTFKYSRNQTSEFSTVVDEEEHEHVDEILPLFATKTEAITYLYIRGWPTKEICNKIHYDDGRPLLAPHVNQVKAKAKASGITEVRGHY